MVAAIDQFYREHLELLGIFEDISTLGIGDPESRRLLASIEDELTAHLQREEDYFSNLLALSEVVDDQMYRTLQRVRSNMEDVSMLVAHFFDDWDSSSPMAAREFDRLRTRIVSRIRMENEELFPLYIKLANRVEQLNPAAARNAKVG